MAFNSRLFFWLLKAYFKRWGRLIFVYFILGLAGFFLLGYFITVFAPRIPIIHRTNIGLVGNVTEDTLPRTILTQLSRGLTQVDASGAVQPDIAQSWDIQNNGKTYTFHLRKGLHFSDGSILTSKDIAVPFSDITINTPNDTTLVLNLQDVYAPLLVKMSYPVFKKDTELIGVSDTKVRDVKLNDAFVTRLTLVSDKDPYHLITYNFYPTQEALKLALVLGDIDEAQGLRDTSFKDGDIAKFPNMTIKKTTDYGELVTLFFNTTDSNLSDKRLRNAFTMTMPEDFSGGEVATSFYPPISFAFSLAHPELRNIDQGAKYFSDTKASNMNLTLTTTQQYQPLAKQLVDQWSKFGVNVHIDIVQGVPDTFQMYLGSFNVPQDPDQYTLWHSGEDNNITHYDNKRIDLLLEEGRKTLITSDRIKIYSDLQKYLLDDAPAAFLYFPYSYDITRK